jgi:hypothetical protein
MATFSFVKDEDGTIQGVWVSNPADAQDVPYVTTLLIRGGLAPETIAGRFRVVPNNEDNRGGCFVMLEPHRAPGEAPPTSFGVTEIVIAVVVAVIIGAALFMLIYRSFVPPQRVAPPQIAPQVPDQVAPKAAPGRGLK